jgi:16S rRNA (cytidine1402-2'-O)-methyltransferase
MISAKLYLLPNLLGVCPPSDVLPERTITIASGLRHFACETPKAGRAFLKTLNMPVAIADLHICEIPAARIVLDWLQAGFDVGVVSDAGCPGTADPGNTLVSLAHSHGFAVVPLVGPSAILLGLMASGMDGQRFRFHGYLPAEKDAREAKVRELDLHVQRTGETQIFIETPYRNAQMLASICAAGNAKLAFCCALNLTTTEERIISKPIGKWTSTDIAHCSAKAPALFLLGRLATR